MHHTALYSTSNVASITADCKNDQELVKHLVGDVQDVGRAITGSGEELSYLYEYCMSSFQIQTGSCVKLYTYDLDLQWATATSAVK